MTPLQLAERCRERLAEGHGMVFTVGGHSWLPALLSFAEQRLARAVGVLSALEGHRPVGMIQHDAEQEISTLAKALGVEG